MANTVHLLIIDPQNDFCDLPEDYCPEVPGTGDRLAPALPVAGAHRDMLRVADFIRGAGARLTDITVTLDSHHRVDIAHPTFWRSGAGAAVPPFTAITAAQVRAGEFVPREAASLDRVLGYLDALEARGRYTLMVWPVHCEIGSWGHDVHLDVRRAYNRWEEQHGTQVRKVAKGENPWTEHYSALLAEVPLDDDPKTQLNTGLVQALDAADTLLICGEASSHCVRATTEHLVARLPDRTVARMQRVLLLTDCMSPVTGFEAQEREFLDTMQRHGVTLLSVADAAAGLLG
jgi:nicotinamidase/pyrazinamidase